MTGVLGGSVSTIDFCFYPIYLTFHVFFLVYVEEKMLDENQNRNTLLKNLLFKMVSLIKKNKHLKCDFIIPNSERTSDGEWR